MLIVLSHAVLRFILHDVSTVIYLVVLFGIAISICKNKIEFTKVFCTVLLLLMLIVIYNITCWVELIVSVLVMVVSYVLFIKIEA